MTQAHGRTQAFIAEHFPELAALAFSGPCGFQDPGLGEFSGATDLKE